MIDGLEYVEHIRRALWSKPYQHGASVMVGAGFSLNAVPLRPGVPPFLLWSQLLKRFEDRLGYKGSSGRGISDALRLAAEFESAFSPAELEQLLREAAPDDDYLPGPLHSLLVSLPWADIFTTNYDRLIERAAAQVPDAQYSILATTADIGSSPRPRIVKLHGSFPSTRPFIITEEHYRTYPKAFAPFVNLVQQSAMESCLCLIGFSGDDPNFLQWTGWVRDHLGASAPPIYWCGVLDILPPRKHLLRSRGVIPIDLGPLVPTTLPTPVRHQRALEWFLLTLRNGEPPDLTDWPTPPVSRPDPRQDRVPPLLANDKAPTVTDTIRPPAFDSLLTTEHLVQLVLHWRSERLWYPGWITLPEPNRTYLSSETSSWLGEHHASRWTAAIRSLSVTEELFSWHELVWRLDRCLLPLTTPLVAGIVSCLERVNPFPDHVALPGAILRPPMTLPVSVSWPQKAPALDWDQVGSYWVAIAFAALRTAREDFDDSLFQRLEGWLSPISSLRPEWTAQLHYERCARRLFLLQPQALTEALAAWTPDPSQPFWVAKRAAITAEIGDESSALSEVTESLKRFQVGQPLRPPSIAAKSQEGWLLWLLDALHRADLTNGWTADAHTERRRRMDRLGLLRCDPDDQISALTRTLRTSAARNFVQDSITSTFDPGVETLTRSFSNVDPWDWVFVRLLDVSCAPIRLRLALFSDALVSAARILFFDGSYQLSLSLLLRHGDADSLATVLGRSTVAALGQEAIDALYVWFAQIVRDALELLESNPNSVLANRLIAPTCEALSRLFFRLGGAHRRQTIELAVELHEHRTIAKGLLWGKRIDSLFRRIFFSLSPEESSELLPTFLALSIHGRPWPEVLDRLTFPAGFRLSSVEKRGDCGAIVQHLLESARRSGAERSRAIRRLVLLAQIGGLSEPEKSQFATALWSHHGSDGLPSDTEVIATHFLSLPHPEDVDPGSLLKTAILRTPLPAVIDEADGIRGVSQKRVDDADAHLRMIEASSIDSLGIYQTKARGLITWSSEEALALLSLLDIWAGSVFQEEWRARGVLDDLADRTSWVAAVVIAPGLSADPKRYEPLLNLTRSLGSGEQVRLIVAPLELLRPGADPDAVCARIIEGFHTSDKDGVKLDAATIAMLLWLGYAKRGLTAATGKPLVAELVASLATVRRPGLETALKTMARVVTLFPDELDPDAPRILLRTLDYLGRDTAPGGVGNGLDSVTPKIRTEAAALAFSLHKYHQIRGITLPSILLEWQRICQTDVLPEVRHAWRESSI